MVGLFPGKAVLVIDGGAPRTVAVGASVAGVRLLAVDQDSATVDIGGKRQRLAIGQHAHSGGDGGGPQVISLTADARGHFITTGTVNGATIRFMVDTGATSVVLTSTDAARLGLEPKDLVYDRPVVTADGRTEAAAVVLDHLSIAGARVDQVEALVIAEGLEPSLLGMSYLGRLSRFEATPTALILRP